MDNHHLVTAVFEPTGIVDPPTAKACEPYTGPALSSLHAYEGTLHEHSSYSDGDIHTTPGDYFRRIRDQGYDYTGSSEHSDTLDAGVFLSVGSDCFSTPDGLLTCLTPSVDELAKWNSVASQVAEVSDGHGFLGIRGFEWTSDRFGHINVYFSKNFSNAKTDGGYLLTMESFWSWFTRDPGMPGLGGSLTAPVPFGGGNDGLAHFNHPNDKCLSDSDAGCDWNGYALIPDAVERMFGMEVYNDGNGDDRYLPYYVTALDKGWRLAPIGSEDEHELKFGSEERPKTVTLAESLDETGFRAAWLARRTYALSPGWHLRAELSADGGHPMGSRLSCEAGKTVPLEVKLSQKEGSAFSGEYRLYASGSSEPLAVQQGANARFELPVPTVSGETRWYFVRVHGGADNKSVAYLAPVWVSAK
ncbi:MAG: hypothetical protein EPN60_01885 [Nevskiaceae bacterium]|nr:MAG: hypothetical protein EPN60_01885 [Nevskiaceae bacterium]